MQTEWKNFSHLKRQHIFRLPKSINSKHWKSEEDFDLEKAAANWARGGGGVTVTCSPNEQQKLGFNLYEFLFWLNQALYKHC